MPVSLVSLQELNKEALIQLLHHCPLSPFFACMPNCLDPGRASHERARYLATQMLTKNSELCSGLEGVSERALSSERSQGDHFVRGHRVVIADIHSQLSAPR